MSEIRIGISGWRYPPWRGSFYPAGLPQKNELAFASRQLNSIEINGSFYSLQRPSSYESWREQTPEEFVFSVKGSRYITHVRRLNDVREPLANFLASGVLRLEEKLGPFLWQFPPTFKFDAERIQEFFDLLPRDTRAAARLARRHSPWMGKDRVSLTPGRNRPLRHCMEIRNESFCTPEFAELLRKNDVALVFADSAGKWPYLEDVTSDFVYLRLHGEGQMYVGGYDDPSIERWAAKLRRWVAGFQPEDAQTLLARGPRRKRRDAYVYFDNDVKVRAPFDALALLRRLTDFEPEVPMGRNPGEVYVTGEEMREKPARPLRRAA